MRRTEDSAASAWLSFSCEEVSNARASSKAVGKGTKLLPPRASLRRWTSAFAASIALAVVASSVASDAPPRAFQLASNWAICCSNVWRSSETVIPWSRSRSVWRASASEKLPCADAARARASDSDDPPPGRMRSRVPLPMASSPTSARMRTSPGVSGCPSRVTEVSD